jgi:hypothetical protein
MVLSERSVYSKYRTHSQELFSKFPADISFMLRKCHLWRRHSHKMYWNSGWNNTVVNWHILLICATHTHARTQVLITYSECRCLQSICLWNLYLDSVSPIPANITRNACLKDHSAVSPLWFECLHVVKNNTLIKRLSLRSQKYPAHQVRCMLRH